MYTREVKIEEYWPLIVKNTEEFGQIAVAENPEFNQLAKCIYDALKDAVITDATPNGVAHWERMLGLVVTDDMSLDDRKAAILTRLSIKLPYTMRVLKQLIAGIVGEGNVRIDYVNDEGKLIIHTDRISDEKIQTVRDLIARVVPRNPDVELYNHNMEISWRDINKYAECTNVADLLAVNANYKNDLTSENEWIYPLTGLKTTGLGYGDTNGFSHSNAESMDLYLPNATSLYNLCYFARFTKKVHIYAPKATNVNSLFRWANALESVTGDLSSAKDAGDFLTYSNTLKRWSLPMLKVTNGRAMFYRCYALEDVQADFPALSDGDLMFTDCILNKWSVIRICNSLPAYTSGTHKITFGIHVDYQTDSDMLNAIANAKAKGWTVTTQWNGTATAGVSTTDLEEIYCKVEESEHGEYTDENGTRCILNWGHSISSPDGKTPSELGYKLFFSIYDAEQYFKLTKIEGIENE